MNYSFEILTELSFFIPELLKWIGIQEIGRLKCTSKKIQSKLTIQNIRPLLEENLTFRTLIFRNQLDIIEQIIPFKFNKRKHKFPQQILKALFNKAASEGKLNLINLILSEKCLDVFAFCDVIEVFKKAIQNGQFEIAKMIFNKAKEFVNSGIADPITLPPPTTETEQGMLESEFFKSYTPTFRNQDFTMYLLSRERGLPKDVDDKFMLFEEIKKMTAELKSDKNEVNNINTNTNNPGLNISAHHQLEYLYFLSSMYAFQHPFKIYNALLTSNFENEKNREFLLRCLISHPQIIENFQQHLSAKGQLKVQQKSAISNMWLSWYAFIDDYDKFSQLVYSLKTKNVWPLLRHSNDHCPFLVILTLTIERNLPTKYFDLCMNACENITKLDFKQTMNTDFQQFVSFLVPTKRFDLLEPLFKLIAKFDLLNGSIGSILNSVIRAGDLVTLKWLSSQSNIPDMKLGSDNTLIDAIDSLNLEVVRFVFDLRFLPGCDPWRFALIIGNMDICRLIFSHKIFRNKDDLAKDWAQFIRDVVRYGDEDMLRFLFSLQFEFLTPFTLELFATTFLEEMKRPRFKIINREPLNEVFNWEMKKLKELESKRNECGEN